MRWGFIGASNIAERVAASLAQVPGQQLVGVYSRNAARATQLAAALGAGTGTDTLQRLLDLRPDAVYISSTNELHAQQTLAALERGCHVLCEKPLAMDLAQARSMVDAAARAGRVLATNHHLRAHGAHQLMRELLRQGAIGAVHSAQVSHAVYLPPHLQGWRLDQPQAGGGVLLDILVHDADLLRMLLGGEARAIVTRTRAAGLARAGLEDNAMSVIEFDAGVLAQTHESFVSRNGMTRLHLLGDRGTLYAEGSLSQAGSARLWLRDDAGERELVVDPVDLYARTLQAFVVACAGSGEPLSSGRDGLASLAVALAALESARQGCRVAVEG